MNTQQEWKSAIDHLTGRTYYYDTRTRKTQWRKPPMHHTSKVMSGEYEAGKKKTKS
jgi:YHS domain-containing protein